ncbi:MAG: hypothetical protein WKF37_16975 [Bryobacteraceae bacterium]
MANGCRLSAYANLGLCANTYASQQKGWGCDAIVANGYGISLAARMEKPMFVICSGSDLEMLASKQYLEDISGEGRDDIRSRLRRRIKAWLYKRLVPLQREGFRRAVGVEYALPGILPYGDALLTDIGVSEEHRHAFMLTDLQEVPKTPLPCNGDCASSVWRGSIGASRCRPGSQSSTTSAMIFCFTASRVRRRHRTPIELRLVNKGLHVRETRRW